MLRHLLLFTWLCVLAALSSTRVSAFQNSKVHALGPGNPVGGPQIGLVLVSNGVLSQAPAVQSSFELRAIVGAPGAAVISDSITLPENLTGVWIAPRQSYAMVARGGGDIPMSVLAIRELAPTSPQVISGALSQPDAVTFGPLGGSAALYSSASGRVQVITGLPASPRIVCDYVINVPSRIRFLAVSDDGSAVLAGAADNNIYSLTRAGTATLIESVGNLAAMTFLPGKLDAALVDSSQGLVTMLRGIGDSPVPMVVASHLTGLREDLSLAVADSAGALILSNPGSKQIVTINLSSLEIQLVTNPGGAGMLQPLQHADQFLLSAVAGQSAWIFEYRPEGPRVYFASNIDRFVGSRP